MTAAPPISSGGLNLPSSHQPGAVYPQGVESLRDLIGLGLVLPAGNPLGLADVVNALQARGWEVSGIAHTWVNCGVTIPSALKVTNPDGASRVVDVLVYPSADELEHQWTISDNGDHVPRAGESCAESNVSTVPTPNTGVQTTAVEPVISVRVSNIVVAVPPRFGQESLGPAFTIEIMDAIRSVTAP